MGLTVLLFSLGVFMQNTDTMTLPSQTISVTIQRNATDTYQYLSNPAHFPEWAAGLCLSITPAAEKDHWLLQTVNGPAKARFTEKNKFGIVDHYVTAGTAPEVYIPLRVLENGPGSEVIFTLFRLPGRTDEEHNKDKSQVQQDLQTLKRILEKSANKP